MVPKNGSDKLIARIVYSGPVRAPVEEGQAVGVVRVWRGANVAMEAPVYAAEAVGSGSTMRARDRRRERARDRHVPRGRREALTMGEAAVKAAWRAREVHHLRRRRGVRQIDPDQDCSPTGSTAAKLRAIVTREPGGSPGAEIIRHLVLSGMGKLLGPDAETLLFAAARDDHVRTVIQPALEPGHLGAVRPLLGFDARLSGQRSATSRRAAQRHAAGHHRRSQAGPDHHPRRARRGRPEARRRAARRRARPTGSRRRTSNSIRTCATPIGRSRPTNRERCVLIDANARARRGRGDRSGRRCAIVCSRLPEHGRRRHERPQDRRRDRRHASARDRRSVRPSRGGDGAARRPIAAGGFRMPG